MTKLCVSGTCRRFGRGREVIDVKNIPNRDHTENYIGQIQKDVEDDESTFMGYPLLPGFQLVDEIWLALVVPDHALGMQTAGGIHKSSSIALTLESKYTSR